MPNNKPSIIESPCIRNCCLDDQDICMGCFRHLNEITSWAAADDETKTNILEKCCRRKLQYQQKWQK